MAVVGEEISPELQAYLAAGASTPRVNQAEAAAAPPPPSPGAPAGVDAAIVTPVPEKRTQGAPIENPQPVARAATPQPAGAPLFDHLPDAPSKRDPAPLFDHLPDAPPAKAASRIPAAIADVPTEVYDATAGALRTARDNLVPGYRDMQHEGAIQGVLNTGKGLVALASVPFAPVVGAARALLGHPLADAEHAIGTVINPEVAAKDNPAEMYAHAKEDVDTAMSAVRPKGALIYEPPAAGLVRGAYEIDASKPNLAYSEPRSPSPAAPTTPATAAPTADALAKEAAAREFGINLSKGQSTGDLDAIRYEDMAARGAYGEPAQQKAAPFFEQQFQDIGNAGRDISTKLARTQPAADTPSAAAATINREVGDVAGQELAQRTAAETAAEQQATAVRTRIADDARALRESVAQGHQQIDSPREAGEIVGEGLRESAAADRQNYRNLYNDAFDRPGEFHAAAFEGVGQRIRGALSSGENPVVIDDVTTPVASRAIQDLDNISGLRIQNRADPFGQPNPENIVAVNLRGVDQARKRLVAYYQAARSSNNASDMRAAGRLIDEFDTQVEHAMSNGLFSGDPEALAALQNARGAYARYAQTYRPRQAGDDVGTAMRRIIDRNATPEEIANMITGSGRVGNAGLPVRLADRLEQVFGANSPEWSSVRQAIWQRASVARNTAGEIDPLRSAQGIGDLASSSLGRRMFTPPELAAMRQHAQAVRDLDATIQSHAATQNATRVQNAYQERFGGDGIGASQATIFRRIVEGTATPEETAQGVFGAIGSGNPGNVSRMIGAIERITGPNSDSMAAVRQGVWQKLTQHPLGKDQPGQQKISQSINEFLNGRGRTIAAQLYTPDEIALMKRYADAVKLTVIPKYARTNSDTAPAMLAAINKYGSAILSALGVTIDHGITGGLAGYGVGALLRRVVEGATEGAAARRIGASLAGVSNQPAAQGGTAMKLITGAAGASNLKLPGPPGIGLDRLGKVQGGENVEANDNGSVLPGRVGQQKNHGEGAGPENLHGGGQGMPAPALQQGTGERHSPIKLEGPLDVHHGAELTAQPSPAQAEAGNYQKRHVKWMGLPLTIETEAGKERTGVGADGKPWSATMAFPYGYIRGTVGSDKDHMDVFVGPRPYSQKVFVIDQANPADGKFDEHKIVIGARSPEEAQSIYDSSFSDGSGPKRRGAVSEISVPAFKQWLDKGDTKAPFAYKAPIGPKSDLLDRMRAKQPVTLQELLDDKRTAKELRAEIAH